MRQGRNLLEFRCPSPSPAWGFSGWPSLSPGHWEAGVPSEGPSWAEILFPSLGALPSPETHRALSVHLFLLLNSTGKNLLLLFSELYLPSLRLGGESLTCLTEGHKTTESNDYQNPPGFIHPTTGLIGNTAPVFKSLKVTHCPDTSKTDECQGWCPVTLQQVMPRDRPWEWHHLPQKRRWLYYLSLKLGEGCVTEALGPRLPATTIWWQWGQGSVCVVQANQDPGSWSTRKSSMWGYAFTSHSKPQFTTYKSSLVLTLCEISSPVRATLDLCFYFILSNFKDWEIDKVQKSSEPPLGWPRSPFAPLGEDWRNDGATPGGGAHGQPPYVRKGSAVVGATMKCPDNGDDACSGNDDSTSSAAFASCQALCWGFSMQGFVYFSAPFHREVLLLSLFCR